MPDLHPAGRALLLFGGVLAALGLALMCSPKLPWLGRLPGDLLIQRGRFTLYVPLTSCLLASLVISLMLRLVGRFRP